MPTDNVARFAISIRGENDSECFDFEEMSARTLAGLHYKSLDELFFVLVNLNVSPEGNA